MLNKHISFAMKALRKTGVAAILATSLVMAQGMGVPAHAKGPLPIPQALFPITHPVGQQRLTDTDYNQAYWPLAAYFETQKNQAYCSVATSVIALNALDIARPKSADYPDFPFFTQQNFFDKVDTSVADPAVVSKEGMTMDQLVKVLGQFPVTATPYHAHTLSLDQFRSLIVDNVRFDDRFVLLNFDRKGINEVGGGHWSPLAAYHPASDSALILDVARYKYPPMWVPVTELYRAAQSVDDVSGISRGLVVMAKQ